MGRLTYGQIKGLERTLTQTIGVSRRLALSRGAPVSERQFGSYTLRVQAGPVMTGVDIDVKYYDVNGEEVGTYGESTIAFCTTWKDVAHVVRKGLDKLGMDDDPVSNVSPMVDLS